MIAALPGDTIAVVDQNGIPCPIPEWLDIAESPWTGGADLVTPLTEADRERVAAAVVRASGEQGHATTVARLDGAEGWSLLSFLDATDHPDLRGFVVSWISSIDGDTADVDSDAVGPLHGPWLTQIGLGDRSVGDDWVDDELGPWHDDDASDRSPLVGTAADAEQAPTAIDLDIEDLPVPAAYLDRDGTFTVANRRWYQLLGLTVGDGEAWLDLFDEDDVARLEALAQRSSEVDTTVRIPRHAGHRWIRVRGLSRPTRRGAGGLWLLEDVTDNVNLVGTIAELESRRHDDDPDAGTTAAVLVVGIEGLSDVRRQHGETAADLVLSATDERLRNVVRPHDHVGQLASDEFAIVCTRMHGGDGALAVAHRILEELESPFEIGDDEFTLALTIGVAVTDDPDVDPDALLSDAAAARNEARRRGVALSGPGSG